MFQNKIPNTQAQQFILESLFDAIGEEKGSYASQWAVFKSNLSSHGFELLGRGWYSSVWGHRGRVYKVNSGTNGERDGFARWLLECRGKSNPHLPKQGGELLYFESRYCVELEKLTPFGNKHARQFFNRGHVDYVNMEDLAVYIEKTPKLFDAIQMAYWVVVESTPDGEFIDNPQIRDMLKCLDYLNGHLSNLMIRGETIVLNDPVAYCDNTIGQFIDYLGHPVNSEILIECAA